MISVVQLGTLDYAEGLRLQQKLVDLRKQDPHKKEKIGDVLLLLEHSPVITLGRNAKTANVLASPEALAARGVEVFECDRGGDVTFHGPGQLVGYPILDLRGYSSVPQVRARSLSDNLGPFSNANAEARPCGADTPVRENLAIKKTLGVVDYVRQLEEVLISTCADFGIPTHRVPGLTGVWTGAAGTDASVGTGSGGTGSVGTGALARPGESKTRLIAHEAAESKIAAIGVHVSRSVTSHGFALNVNTDLSHFNLIVPCGITAKPVTSMQKELGRELDWNEVAQSVARNFGSVFASPMLWVDTIDALLGNTVGVPMKAPAQLRRLRGELQGEDDLFLA
jgi:lipoyl(octanoyl) transferase